MSEFIKKNHEGSILTLLRIYNLKGALYSGSFLWVAISVDVCICCVFTHYNLDTYKLIKDTVDLYIQIIPNLLGFNLGAYALLIGLSSSNLINKFSKKFETRITLFQRASSVFGFCVLLQAITLIITFLYKQIIIFQEDILFEFLKNNMEIKDFNMGAFFFLNLFGIYSIIIILKVIENIFSLSQLAHFYSGMEQKK